MNTRELLNELEQIVDKSNLSTVLNVLSEICYEKEDHLQSNWNDANTAKLWHNAGKIIDSANCKLINKIDHPMITK